MTELAQYYPEMAELSEDEIKEETEEWQGLVARNLCRKVLVEVAACKFWLHAGLKGNAAAYNLEQGFLLFQFREEESETLSWASHGWSLVKRWQ